MTQTPRDNVRNACSTIMALALEISTQGHYVVFVRYSAHINQISLEVCPAPWHKGAPYLLNDYVYLPGTPNCDHQLSRNALTELSLIIDYLERLHGFAIPHDVDEADVSEGGDA